MAIKDFEFFDFDPTPDQINEIYSSGFVGAIGSARVNRLMYGPTPSLAEALPETVGMKTPSIAMPIRGCQVLLGQDFCADRGEAQKTGDCVGAMIQLQGMVDGTNDHYFGETSWKTGDDGQALWYAREPIYGLRGHRGQGANCQRLWNYVGEQKVGFAYRGVIGGVDLSQYEPGIEHRWGRTGVPEAVLEATRLNPALRVYRIRSMEEAKRALALGYGLGRCGMEGYSNRRNQDGVSGRRGRWAHAIAVGGYDDSPAVRRRYGGALWLFYHCWGPWNSGPKRLEQPDGSWFVESGDFNRQIQRGSVYCVASVAGFDRKLIWQRGVERMTKMYEQGFLAA